MITLPFAFDTAAPWRTIVKRTVQFMAILGVLILAAIVTQRLVAALQLTIIAAVLSFICLRARAIPMGAAGRITEREVIAEPVTVYGIALRVPSGCFPLDAFRGIRVDETLRGGVAGQRLRAIGQVFLAGDGAAPDVEVVSADRDVAYAAAAELSTLLKLKRVPA